MADAPMPPPADDEALPLSALQHWAYCPRQCALIHLDQAFDDNLHTLRGRQDLLPRDWGEQRRLLGFIDA